MSVASAARDMESDESDSPAGSNWTLVSDAPTSTSPAEPACSQGHVPVQPLKRKRRTSNSSRSSSSSSSSESSEPAVAKVIVLHRTLKRLKIKIHVQHVVSHVR